MWPFLAFAVAFAIKVPVFPFHTWLPDAHVEAPTAGSVILAGVLLKMGTYGLLRFAFPLFPLAALYFAPWLAVLAVVVIVDGGLFLIVGMLADRRHTRLISEYGSLKAVMPQLVAAFLLVTLASVALPGMNGFVGEFLILLGAFGATAVRPAGVYTAIAATGVI